jgi:hypothetical protein
MTHRVLPVGLQPSQTRETYLSFSTAARYRQQQTNKLLDLWEKTPNNWIQVNELR